MELPKSRLKSCLIMSAFCYRRLSGELRRFFIQAYWNDPIQTIFKQTVRYFGVTHTRAVMVSKVFLLMSEQTWRCITPLNMGSTRSTLVICRSHLSHTDFDKTAWNSRIDRNHIEVMTEEGHWFYWEKVVSAGGIGSWQMCQLNALI